MLRVLYVNAIMSAPSGECMREGVVAGLNLAQCAREEGVEVDSFDIFYGAKQFPRLMGDWVRDHHYDAIVLSGSEKNTTDMEDPWLADYYEGLRHLLDVRSPDLNEWEGPPLPILGICFAHQALAVALGGETARMSFRVGVEKMRRLPQADRHPVLKVLNDKKELEFVVYHADQVIRPPRGFHACLTSDYCTYQALAHDRWPILTLQSHPEMTERMKAASDDKEIWDRIPTSAFQGNDGPRLLGAFLDWTVARQKKRGAIR